MPAGLGQSRALRSPIAAMVTVDKFVIDRVEEVDDGAATEVRRSPAPGRVAVQGSGDAVMAHCANRTRQEAWW